MVRTSLAIPCLFILSGCMGAGTPYTSPWAPAEYWDRSLSLYSSPWNAPLPEPAEPPPYLVPSEVVPRKSETQVPLEPVGPWVSRHAALPSKSVSVLHEPVPMHAEASSPSAPALPPQGPDATTDAIRPQSSIGPQPVSVASLSGRWVLRLGRDTCQIQLSTSSTLDLYKASTSRCNDARLRDVNTWALRGESLELYSKGRVIVHLEPNGSAYSGRIENRGLSMTR